MNTKKINRNDKLGFTMIEVMAVLIIIGLLGTVVATQVINRIEIAKKITTRANLKTYHTAVNSFRMDNNRFPSDEEGLSVLIEKPSDASSSYPEGGYLDMTSLEPDGWKHDFIYELTPGSGPGFVIRSCGPDGEQDTEDDLLSTDVEK
jgi:general secretion pathway protein G